MKCLKLWLNKGYIEIAANISCGLYFASTITELTFWDSGFLGYLLLSLKHYNFFLMRCKPSVFLKKKKIPFELRKLSQKNFMLHISQIKGMQNDEIHKIKNKWVLTGLNSTNTWKLTPMRGCEWVYWKKIHTFSGKSFKIYHLGNTYWSMSFLVQKMLQQT